MTASWNQKYNLLVWAKKNNYTQLYNELEMRNVVGVPMSEWRYKKMRNAILFNRPADALKLIQHYPIDYNNLDVSAPRGGEL